MTNLFRRLILVLSLVAVGPTVARADILVVAANGTLVSPYFKNYWGPVLFDEYGHMWNYEMPAPGSTATPVAHGIPSAIWYDGPGCSGTPHAMVDTFVTSREVMDFGNGDLRTRADNLLPVTVTLVSRWSGGNCVNTPAYVCPGQFVAYLYNDLTPVTGLLPIMPPGPYHFELR